MPSPTTTLRGGLHKKEIDRKSISSKSSFANRFMYILGDLRAYVMNSAELLGGRFVQKFKGVNEALERRYLRELILVVTATEDSDKDAIEVYSWRLRYDVDGDPRAELTQADGTIMAALRFRGMQYLKKQVAELLLMIRTLCRETLSPLPAGVSSALRITYNERAPKGYQAPGFHRSPQNPVLRPDAQEIEIVAMQTKHHGASVVVRSIFIDDAYAVGLRLKEAMKLDGLDDSLNESFGEEQGAGDDAQRSDNDTMERISGSIVEQIDVMEEGRGDHVTKETEGYYSPAINTSLIEMRGSPTDTVAISLDETKPKRGRRGQPTVAEVSLVEGTTPPRNAQKKNNLDTPPSRKTPGAVRTSKVHSELV
ncbi:HORMA domain protein [Ancylostoma ceylanicum]|uniref:HORMA domain protein n=1 Tax=Ancylostoma ceylanicum TaxID=53326 RepID=A0A0D6LRN0_9BILA|nr:HORMA domain protein [Ancylostoma ceylanicum]